MNSGRILLSFARGEKVSTESESLSPIARSVLLRLLQSYGRNTRVVDFFQLYGDLQDYHTRGPSEEPFLGLDPKTEFYVRFRRSIGQIDSMVELEATRNRLSEQGSKIEPLLRKIDSGFFLSPIYWKTLIDAYSDMIQAVGADKKIYTVTRRLPGEGPVRWRRVQRTSEKEEATEILRREDPDLYARMNLDRLQREEVNDRINLRIKKDGYTPGVRIIANRPVSVGIGPSHGVDGKTDLRVYDIDGEVTTVPEFIQKIKDKVRVSEGLIRINPSDRMRFDELNHLRKAPIEQYAEELSSQEGEFISLTDDPDKESSLTRIYKVKVLPSGEQVVTEGRFRGFYVADLVNQMGRQIEGSSYTYDPETSRIVRREVLNPDGSVQARASSEPYVTVSKGKLFLRVSNEHEYSPVRKALMRLSKTLPTLYEPLPKQRPFLTRWYFDPKDFSTLRSKIGGMALSYSASKFLQEYFTELSKAEQASNAKNLSRYSNSSLGFKETPGLELRTHIKKSLAWLDANGNKGVCALDTGMGKTAVAIASMQNLLKKGEGGRGNGRFLYVCDKSLRGNLPSEIGKFLPEASEEALLEIIDIRTYPEFRALRRKSRTDPKDPNSATFGDSYIAIYFDEAHLEMNKKTSATYKAVVGVKCPHKILMTASPMSRSPREVLTMASAASGLDLNSPEGSSQERKFLGRYAQSVGGRVVGITQDPVTGKDFRVWVKRNLFFSDKREVDEESAQLAVTGLGKTGRDLRKESVLVTMPPSIEAEYRSTMKELLFHLKEWKGYGQFTGEQLPLAIDMAKSQRAISALLRKLTLLSDTPDEVLPGSSNPKIDQTVNLVLKNLGRRTLVFAESDKLVKDLSERLRRELPAQGIVSGYSKHILYYSPEGKEIVYTEKGWKGLSVEMEGARYLPYIDPKDNTPVPKTEWATFTLTKLLGLGTNYVPQMPSAVTVLTGNYAVGQNLQSFGTVVHMDRDAWNAETMKQRTARAWRAGNKQPVDEYTIDLVYPDSGEASSEKTLDEIRRTIQEIDTNLFDRVVLDSQVEKLGEEWVSIKKQRSALRTIDRKMFMRSLSPYARQMGREETEI